MKTDFSVSDSNRVYRYVCDFTEQDSTNPDDYADTLQKARMAHKVSLEKQVRMERRHIST